VNGIEGSYKKVLGENYRTPEPSLRSKPEFRDSFRLLSPAKYHPSSIKILLIQFFHFIELLHLIKFIQLIHLQFELAEILRQLGGRGCPQAIQGILVQDSRSRDQFPFIFKALGQLVLIQA
jgi:hypothetical protein